MYWVRSLPFSLFMYLKEKQYNIAKWYSCARYKAPGPLVVPHFSCLILSCIVYIFYTGSFSLVFTGREWETLESQPFRSVGRYQYHWYEPRMKGERRGIAVNLPALFIPGYTAIEKYIGGDDMIASQVPAFKALERFWKQKGKLISFVVPTLAYFIFRSSLVKFYFSFVCRTVDLVTCTRRSVIPYKKRKIGNSARRIYLQRHIRPSITQNGSDNLSSGKLPKIATSKHHFSRTADRIASKMREPYSTHSDCPSLCLSVRPHFVVKLKNFSTYHFHT